MGIDDEPGNERDKKISGAKIRLTFFDTRYLPDRRLPQFAGRLYVLDPDQTLFDEYAE